MSALEQAALEYAPRSVMLLGKRPAVGSAWPRWRATPDTIADWIAEHGHHPLANVGIESAADSWRWTSTAAMMGTCRLSGEQRHGPLPPTAEVATGGGGRHLYFSTDRELDIRSRNLRHSGIAGIEIKALGAQLVAPPSIHPDTGREYVWIRALTEIAPLPNWVAVLACSRKPRTITDGGARRGCSDRTASFQSATPWPASPARCTCRASPGVRSSRAATSPVQSTATSRSVKVYPDAGWYCFGCGVGGGIYQLAALLGGWTLPLSR